MKRTNKAASNGESTLLVTNRNLRLACRYKNPKKPTVVNCGVAVLIASTCIFSE